MRSQASEFSEPLFAGSRACWLQGRCRERPDQRVAGGHRLGQLLTAGCEIREPGHSCRGREMPAAPAVSELEVDGCRGSNLKRFRWTIHRHAANTESKLALPVEGGAAGPCGARWQRLARTRATATANQRPRRAIKQRADNGSVTGRGRFPVQRRANPARRGRARRPLLLPTANLWGGGEPGRC